jgi:hypothetical protein
MAGMGVTAGGKRRRKIRRPVRRVGKKAEAVDTSTEKEG